MKKNKFRKAVKQFKKGADIAFKENQIADYVYRQMCVIRFNILLGKYAKSIKKLEKLKDQYPEVFEENKYALGMWHFLKGSALFYLGKGGEIREEANSATEILGKKAEFSGLDLVDYCQALLLEGKANWHYRDILASFSCFVKVIKLILQLKSREYDFLIGKACGLIGVVLLDMNQTALGKEYLLLGLSFLKQQDEQFSKNHLYVGIINSDLALAYLKSAEEGNFDDNLTKIEQHVAEAQNIFTGIYADKAHRYLAAIEKHNARLLRVRHQANWKDYADGILAILDKELLLRKKSFLIPKHRTYARVHNIKSNIYTAIGELDMGLAQAQEALIRVSDLEDKYLDQPEVNPTEKQLAEHVSSPTEQLKALYNKGRIYLKKYEQSDRDISYLGLVLDNIHLGLSYIKDIMKKLNSDEARMILIEQTRPLNELVVELLYISYQLQKEKISLPNELRPDILYETVQHNKSFLLMDTINKDFVDDVTPQPNSAKSNKSLLGTLEELQQNLVQNPTVDQPNHHLDSVASALIDIVEQIEELKHEQPVKPLAAESLAATQNGLDDNDAGILSYFMGQGKLIMILVTKQDLYVQELIETEAEVGLLKKNIKELHQIVKVEINKYQHYSIGPHKASFDNPIKRFTELSYAIYQKVLLPINHLEQLSRLYIIPDRELWFIPFEALLTEPVKNALELEYHELPYYILQRKLVSYHFSTRAISSLYNKAGKNGDMIAAINHIILTAGDGRSVNEENDIGRNINRWKKKIQSIFPDGPIAEKFTLPGHKDAVDLFRTIQIFDAVVLAAHGSYERNEYPKIRLTPNKSISIRDIKKAGRLNWELLVLYSCFSGEGELRNGEGLRTLCRAFFEQHVKNIVYSLYMVNSWKNKAVMDLFFDYIVDVKDETKHCFARALYEAKLKVAQTSQARPGDWSGLLFIGDQKKSLFN